jgi:hypothetical protein
MDQSAMVGLFNRINCGHFRSLESVVMTLTFKEKMQSCRDKLLEVVETAISTCEAEGEILLPNDDYKKCKECIMCRSNIFYNPTCCALDDFKAIINDLESK